MEGNKGGEVRRVHVLYFLSRDGAIEQPHLIRVHHLHRNGVHLRDVKRWLSDLRGKDMPDSFAWSYKRTYKSGYVWQDLMDDDLITPISDNEYILKGSELSSKFDSPLLDTESSNDEEQQSPQAPDLNTYPEFLHIEIDTKTDSSKPPPESDSPPLSGSDISGDSNKHASMIKLEVKESEVKEKEQETNEDWDERRLTRANSTTTNWWSGRKKSHIFRNLFRCGGAEANDKALMKVQREERYRSISEGSYKRTTMADRFRDDKCS